MYWSMSRVGRVMMQAAYGQHVSAAMLTLRRDYTHTPHNDESELVSTAMTKMCDVTSMTCQHVFACRHSIVLLRCTLVIPLIRSCVE